MGHMIAWAGSLSQQRHSQRCFIQYPSKYCSTQILCSEMFYKEKQLKIKKNGNDTGLN